MKDNIIYAVSLLAVGAGLVAYAHANFPTKSELGRIIESLDRIEARLYDLQERSK